LTNIIFSYSTHENKGEGMKKILGVLLLYLIVFLIFSENIYAANIVSAKSSYRKGTLEMRPGQKGRLIVREESIVFSYGKNELEIPFDSITRMSWSEKERKLKADILSELSRSSGGNKYSLFEPLPPVYIPTPFPEIKHEKSPIYYVLFIIAAAFLVAGIVRMFSPKKVYFRVDFKIGIKHEWALFQATEKEFNTFYLILIKKSGKEIELYE
jgi:hypothetical protein